MVQLIQNYINYSIDPFLYGLLAALGASILIINVLGPSSHLKIRKKENIWGVMLPLLLMVIYGAIDTIMKF